MALPSDLRAKLSLPVFCAPMLTVSSPALVRAVCNAGLMAGMPRRNAGGFGNFGSRRLTRLS